ncbi:hypothetical protein [Metabacillus litoralis]|uniref:hypothetical protein n=1 Tax=Metabacillus litoralis TaxID=152268 RepID=UPI0025595C9D|nr:hypothetical protein [Metabacillus litoralis]
MSTVRELRARFTAQAEGMKAVARSVKKDLQGIGDTTEKSTKRVNNGFGDLNKSLASLDKNLQKVGDAKGFEDLNKTLRKVRTELASTGKISAQSMKELQVSVKGAKDNFGSLGDEGKVSLSGLNKFLNRVDAQLGNIDFDNLKDGLSDVNDELVTTGDQFDHMNRNAKDAGSEFGNFRDKTSGVLSEIRALKREMQSFKKEMELATLKAVLPFKKKMIETERDMFKLAHSMGNYSGSTKEFMGQVNQLGKEFKKTQDAMINADRSIAKSMIQTAGQMANMSTQASKISDNYTRMANPIYNVNKAGLAVADTLNKIANNGNAATLALKLLGPNASMKQLYDMQGMINQGLMRFQMVALAAVATSALLYTSLFKIAKGPDPSEVYQKQAEALAEYTKAVQDRTKEIMDAWSLFEDIQLKKTSGKQLIKNLDEQVEALKNWRTNLAEISQRAGEEFAQYLAAMGPEAAGEISAITKMSEPELNKYVALWKEKMAQATGQAVSELEELKAATDKKVQELQDSLTPLGLALEPLKQVWAEAIQPMVDAFTMVAVPIVNFLTLIGEMIVKFNEAHPVMALIIQGILMLIPILTLLLSPLAVGIGLIAGFKAALASVWPLIGPLITGLAAMSGTVWIVAAAIIGLVAGIMYLWKTNETFRNGIISGWNAIKAAAVAVWGFIKPYIMQAIEAVVGFVREKMSQLKTFWDQNGAQILQAGKNVWNVISTVIKTVMNAIWSVMKFVWPVILELIKSVWNNIKGVIDGALNIIMGLVKVFSGLLTGDFGKMWEGIKQIFFGAIQLVWNWINLLFVGRILGAGKLLFSGLKSVMTTLWTTLKNIFVGGVNAVRNFAVNGFTNMKNLLTGIVTDIKTGINTTFGNIVDAAKALPGKIGDGIKSMAGKAWAGIKSFGNEMAKGFGKIINGATGGINWVMGKLGIDFTIPEWEPPQYAKGTKGNGHPGGPFVAGDGGKEELIIFPDGRMIMSPAKSTLYYGEEGTRVLSGENTKKLLSQLPFYNSGKGLLNNAISSVKETASNAWSGTKKVAGKVKDFAFDVWDYASNPERLMQKVWEPFPLPKVEIAGAFGEIIKGAVNKIKDSAVGFVKKSIPSFDFGGASSVNIKGGASAWRSMIIKAAQAMGEALSPSELNGIIAQIQRESGGNQRIVQSSAVWDVNTAAGNPARGLLQYIPQTFRAYSVKGFNNIYDGYHQLLAFFNNRTWRRDLPYGRRGWGPRGGRKINGFFEGARVAAKQLAWIAEKGAEYIIPTDGGQRAYELWLQAGAENGFSGSDSNNNSPTQNRGASSPPIIINPAPVIIDGHELTEIIFPYVDAKQSSELSNLSSVYGGKG